MERVALISGGSAGIGLAIAKQLASVPKTTVIISARKPEALESARKEIVEATSNQRIFAFPCNFSRNDEIEKLVGLIKEKFGRVDVLVNNVASSLHFGPTIETEVSKVDKMFQVNFRSHFYTTQLVLPLMPKNANSSILFIASYVGIKPDTTIGIYSATKAALVHLTKILAEELLDSKIRVNCICPGLIKTQFSQVLWENGNAPLPIGSPEEVANVASFLASEKASFVTGAIVTVTGMPLL